MKRTMFVVAMTALALGVAASRAVSKDPPVKLGFIEVSKAFDTYRKSKDVADQLKGRREDILKVLKQRAKQIDESANKLDTMNAGTDEYAELDRRISLEKYALDYDRKLAERQLEAEKSKKFAAIYKEICQEAQAYGAEHELAAVLMYQQPDVEQGDNAYLFQATRAVLCHDDQLDVTKEVVARLNAQLPPAPAVAPNTQPKSPSPAEEKKDGVAEEPKKK